MVHLVNQKLGHSSQISVEQEETKWTIYLPASDGSMRTGFGNRSFRSPHVQFSHTRILHHEARLLVVQLSLAPSLVLVPRIRFKLIWVDHHGNRSCMADLTQREDQLKTCQHLKHRPIKSCEKLSRDSNRIPTGTMEACFSFLSLSLYLQLKPVCTLVWSLCTTTQSYFLKPSPNNQCDHLTWTGDTNMTKTDHTPVWWRPSSF